MVKGYSKIGIGLALLLPLAALVMPGFIGSRVEQDSELMESLYLQQSSLERVERTVEKGWFSSTVVSTFKWNRKMREKFREMMEGGDVDGVRVHLRHQVYHGPFPWPRLAKGKLFPVAAHVESRLSKEGGNWPEKWMITSQGFDETLAHVIITSAIPFAGDASTQWQSDHGLRLDLPNDVGPVTVSIPPYEYTVHWNARTRHYYSEGQGPAIKIGFPGGHVILGEHRVDFDWRLLDNGLGVGFVNFSSSIDMDAKGKEPFTASTGSFVLKNALAEDGGLLTSTSALTVEKICINREFQLDKVDVALRLENIDSQATALVIDKIVEVEKEGLIDKEAGHQILGTYVMAQLPEFIKRSPQLTIDPFHVDGLQGAIDGKVHLAIDAPPGGEPFTVFSLMQFARGKVELTVPKGLVREIGRQAMAAQVQEMAAAMNNDQEPTAEEVDALLDQMVEQSINDLLATGKILPKGDHYHAMAEYAKGQLRVNGKPMGM